MVNGYGTAAGSGSVVIGVIRRIRTPFGFAVTGVTGRMAGVEYRDTGAELITCKTTTETYLLRASLKYICRFSADVAELADALDSKFHFRISTPYRSLNSNPSFRSR